MQIKLLRDASDFGYRFGLIFNEHKESAYVANIQYRTYSEGYSAVQFDNFDETQAHAYGDTVSLSAKATTNRGLQKTVTAHCAVTEGGGTVKNDAFNVGLGNSKVKFSFAGFDKEVTVKGATSMPITCDNVKLTDDTVAALEMVNSYTDKNGLEVKNLLKWYIKDMEKQSVTKNGFNFNKTVSSNLQKDRYIYMKVLFTKQCTFYIGGKQENYVYNSSYADGRYELYTANGRPCGSQKTWGTDALVNQWLIIEYKIDDDQWIPSTNDWRLFTFYDQNGCTAEKPAYIGDIEVTLEPKDFSTANIKTDGVTDIAKYGYTYDTTQTTFSEIGSSDVSAVAQKLQNTKVYAWAPAENRVDDFDANKGGISFGISRFMKKDMYLYYDFYVTEKCCLTMFSGANTVYMYNSTKANTESVEWQLYDANGNALTSGFVWGGQFTGQWITVEFKLCADWDSNDCITRYTKDAQDETFYLANIKLSANKLMGTTSNP